MLDTQNALGVKTSDTLPLSVVLAAEGDGQGLVALMLDYRSALDQRDEAYEVILVFDNRSQKLQAIAQSLDEEWAEFSSLPLRPWEGEDAAVKLGYDRAVGKIILTLPSWSEVDPVSINLLIDAVGECDMATGKRANVERSGMQKVSAAATHGLLRVLFQQKFDDVFCRTRAGRREVFLRAAELGVRQHFLPIIAVSEGYEVREISVPSAPKNDASPVYKFKAFAHIGALVDLLTLFIGLKFLKRPLRFFGAVGVPLIAAGLLLTTYLVVERLLFGEALADRPALVFSVMMLVLGIQIMALGLVGEIIIFSTSRRMRSYEIDQIIRGRPADDETLTELALQKDPKPPQSHKG